MMKELEHLCYKERLRELGLLSLEETQRLRLSIHQCIETPERRVPRGQSQAYGSVYSTLNPRDFAASEETATCLLVLALDVHTWDVILHLFQICGFLRNS